MPKVTANGVEIAYNDRGSGDTTIVLVQRISPGQEYVGCPGRGAVRRVSRYNPGP